MQICAVYRRLSSESGPAQRLGRALTDGHCFPYNHDARSRKDRRKVNSDISNVRIDVEVRFLDWEHVQRTQESLMNRRQILCSMAASSMAILSDGAFAEAYPSRPIRMLVGLPPGGAVDTIARLLAEVLGGTLGQPVIVENRPGAAGMLAAEAVARAAPDGYVVGLLDVGALAVNPVLQPKISYDVRKDFKYVGSVARIPLVLVASANSPIRSLQELALFAKSNPGKLNYASSGVGGPLHLAFEAYKHRTGVNVSHISYRGGAPALQDLIAGHVDLMFIDVNLCEQYAARGRLRPLAIATAERSSLIPNIPTFEELGFKGFVASPWSALIAPRNLPPEIATTLSKALSVALDTPTFEKRLSEKGFERWRSEGGALDQFVEAELNMYRALTRDQKIRLED